MDDQLLSVESAVRGAARAAKDAQPVLARLRRAEKDALLHAMAEALVARADEIVAANAQDLAAADESGMAAGLRDRLALDPQRIASIAQQLRDAAALPDPVGEVVRGSVLANGLELRQVRVPMGVIGMVYEARPNVTVDAAGLALKAGSAVVLRGGSAALHSNTALIAVLRDVLAERGLPEDLVVGIDAHGREGADVLMRARGLVDVLIPRGGAGLIRRVVENAQVPVIETGTGTTHVLVDASADLDQAEQIVLNAKTQRVGVCNALETLLVHQDVAAEALPRLGTALAEAGVRLHVDERAAALLPAGVEHVPATEEDWDVEYLALELAVAVVDDLDAALAHIRAHSSGHTESILTRDLVSQQRFLAEVDSAVVMANASTRFSDGGEFGFGAEIGISTQKLHARGPMGLSEITATKWLVVGQGHVRP
ncbi:MULTISPECIES: glutamate-5-semialdehyde dehydrogenase [Brachybacterium]|uniref:Gamma-glutamyl phosphate reductase n=2 Tax=Brachybacterium TaxID=43668 RepID=A0A3R8QVB1_9MICO|nr:MULTISPECIES: glutamate-5-semialdehyde dehydrogenase [Brachybacterium]MCT1438320.1 glutamate-5-semialdehyde dehydrogenase [Brachybacterium paraconglomeratum]RRR19505.1 glutamate-5-semialdehyde dehydrogenase [Brachybacterium paraconglomeratum]TDP76160.1 glutamate-5-semialdehyde dehydrogenase [Brachybacterium sp. AG952]GLI31159.1 gamma-glutamyl phosphate reductase [Brachybacterium conglomeratum]GLK04071.1 gamma-glutamyl phosphate reductase [Brachybacterium conglomeratum]